MTVDLFTIKFTRAGLDYLRQIMGARPYDEVGALIANIELQRREQEAAAQAAAVDAAAPTPAPATATVRRLRAVKRERPPGEPATEAPGTGAMPSGS